MKKISFISLKNTNNIKVTIVMILLIVFMAGCISPALANIVKRQIKSNRIVYEGSDIYISLYSFLKGVKIRNDEIGILMGTQLDIIDAANILEKYGQKLTRDLNRIPQKNILQFLDTSDLITRKLVNLGLSYRRLDETEKIFKNRLNVEIDGLEPQAEVRFAENDIDSTEHKIMLENTFFSTSDSNENSEQKSSDVFKVKAFGSNSDHSVNYNIVVQNKDDDRHYGFINSIEYEEHLPLAYGSFVHPRYSNVKLDIGRYEDNFLFDGFYSGYTDGLRMTIDKWNWNLVLGAESFERRFEKAGFANMKLSFFDSFRGKLKFNDDDGYYSFDYISTSLAEGNGGFANWQGVSTLAYPGIVPVTSEGFSSMGLSFEKDWTVHLNSKGFIEVQDIEDFNNAGLMGRNSEGAQAGLDLEYNHLEGMDRFFANIRVREIDHINLGRTDSIYKSEYLNNGMVVRDSFGNRITENFTNSKYVRFGVDHSHKVKFLRNPLKIRLYYEALDGYKDLDSVTPGMQDTVFTQYATGLVLDYKNQIDWNVQFRVRNVEYDNNDYEYNQYELFRKGSAPDSRLEYDIRIISPVF